MSLFGAEALLLPRGSLPSLKALWCYVNYVGIRMLV